MPGPEAKSKLLHFSTPLPISLPLKHLTQNRARQTYSESRIHFREQAAWRATLGIWQFPA